MRILLMFLVLFTWAFSIETNSQTPRSFANDNEIENLSKLENDILKAINRERQKLDQEELIYDGELSRIARNYSQKMADEKFFSHFDRNGNGIQKRIKDAKIENWRRIAENIFFSTTTDNLTEISLNGWMKSPRHRKNIVDGDFQFTGIGVGISKEGYVYVTQIFMKR